MTSLDLQEASNKREIDLLDEDIDRRIDLLLANYQRVTANPRSMGYLRFLLRHYAKSPTPWRACYSDNLKRWGPQRTAGMCSTLKDTLRQSTHWRGHPELDHGAPGVAIGEADKGAAPPWGGHHLSELNVDCDQMAMPEEVVLIFEDLGEKCDVYRVLIGLDEPPKSEMVLL